MNKQRLYQKQYQNLSPQQIQLLGILQLPIVSLEKRIEEELEENPALEEEEEIKESAGYASTASFIKNYEETQIEDKSDTLKDFLEKQLIDLEFASKICKNTKSNTIVLAKSKKLLSSGVGQTSRIDALKQAITKAKQFGFDLNGAVMASDAFFPFPDCVEIACKEGIAAIIQPGGSINDQLSIDCCNENNMAMVMTGTRHFKH